MFDFILNLLREIFSDFQETVSSMGKLCELKNFNFCGGNAPDYSNIANQQLYLLRYFPAYVMEYYRIYEQIILSNFLNFPLNVLSIGAGSFLDYYGLYFVLQDYGYEPQRALSYTGIDIVDWNYKINLDTSCSFFQYNILNITSLERNDYNIIMFPKSIGELSDSELNFLRKTLPELVSAQDRLIVAGSIRESYVNPDISRCVKIVEGLQTTYKSLDNIYEYYLPPDPNRAWVKYFPEFSYPNDIIDYLYNLNTKCITYKMKKHNCERHCKDLSRYPILKVGNVRYYINRLSA